METKFKTLEEIKQNIKSFRDILIFCGFNENDEWDDDLSDDELYETFYLNGDIRFEIADDDQIEYTINDKYEDGVLPFELGPFSDDGCLSDSYGVPEFFEEVSEIILPESERNFWIDFFVCENQGMVYPKEGVEKSEVDLELVKKHLNNVFEFTESII
jgi:hypothetical protein